VVGLAFRWIGLDMRPNSRVRVGLLGYGFAGRVFHAPFIAANPALTLSAVVTSNPERQAQVRVEHPDAAVLSTADDLWKRSTDLDLVVVAAPNRHHVPLTRAAFDAGLPVVVDKPLAPTAELGRQLIDEAGRHGLLLTVFQNRRWDGDILTLRKLLNSGRLGAVRRFESRFEVWWPRLEGGWRDQGDPEEAGGVLYDLGAHLIDQALLLFGPVASVYGELDQRRAGAAVDDDAFVALTHTSGVRSHLWMSRTVAQAGPRLRVLGDQAAYVKYGFDVQAAALTAGERPNRPGWGEEPAAQWGRVGIDGDVQALRTEPGAYQEFYAAVVAALRDGGPPPVDPEDSLRGLLIIETVKNIASTIGAEVKPETVRSEDRNGAASTHKV
jgi:predicted dehydrogenase